MKNNWTKVSDDLPALIPDEFCGFLDSENVLITDGKTINVGHRRLWDESEVSEWVIKGRDGYLMKNVIAWMHLPELPIN